MGGGFKITGDALEGVDSVLAFAAGSGISPIRSAIESGALKGKKVSLFYGAQTPAQASKRGVARTHRRALLSHRSDRRRRSSSRRRCGAATRVSSCESAGADGVLIPTDCTPIAHGLQMAYQDKFAEWEKLGVSVTPVISKADGTDWAGATGYVQDAAKGVGVPSE